MKKFLSERKSAIIRFIVNAQDGYLIEKITKKPNCYIISCNNPNEFLRNYKFVYFVIYSSPFSITHAITKINKFRVWLIDLSVLLNLYNNSKWATLRYFIYYFKKAKTKLTWRKISSTEMPKIVCDSLFKFFEIDVPYLCKTDEIWLQTPRLYEIYKKIF